MQQNNLDKIDRKIIEILLQDGRISFTKLAKKVDLSRGMVANRMAAMENSGIINRYTVLVSEEYFRKPLPVFFTISVSPQQIGKTAEKISTYEDLVVVYQMSGSRNLHVHGYFEDIQEVYEFVSKNLDTLPGVQDISIEFLLKKFKTDFV